MPKISTSFEVTCAAPFKRPGDVCRVSDTLLVEARAQTVAEAEAAAKAMAREHCVPAKVERITRGPNLFQREEVGTATLDVDGRCWFDLSRHGAPLL